MASTPGLNALEKCEDQVKISIRNEMKVISKYLKDNAIIDRPLYNDVNNPESKDIPEAKATKLYLKLLGEVESDEASYLKFVEFLRNNPKFNNTVAKLDGAYTGKGKSITDNKNLNTGYAYWRYKIFIPCYSADIAWVKIGRNFFS